MEPVRPNPLSARLLGQERQVARVSWVAEWGARGGQFFFFFF